MSSTTKNSLKLSFLTICSRFLGLIRDHFQAIFFGTGLVAYAWEIAMFLPGVLRSLLVEGGAAQAFVPIYSDALKKSRSEAQRSSAVLFFVVFLFMAAVMLACAVAFPYLLPIITSQASHHDRTQLDFIVQLALQLLPFMLPASLMAILAGIANSHRYFVFPALTPIFLNLAMILCFLLISPQGMQMANASLLAYTFVGMGFLQCVLQYFFVWKKGIAPRFSLSIFRLNWKNPTLQRFFHLVLPAIMATAVFHVNQIADIIIASYFIPISVGAIPALRFAQRLIQLPTGIIGVALSTSILPILSSHLSPTQAAPVSATRKKTSIKTGARDEEADAAATRLKEVRSALHFALFLTIPASLGFYFLGEDIINLLFYGGQWDLYSTQMTWAALNFYLLGVPFYSLNKILTSTFFAFKDTRSPLRSIIMASCLNFCLNIILVQWIGHIGIAISTAITAALHSVQMLFYLNKHLAMRWVYLWAPLLRKSIPLLALSLYLFSIDMFWDQLLLPKLWAQQLAYFFSGDLSVLVRYQALPKVLAGVLGGLLLYIQVSLLCGIEEIQMLRRFLSKLVPKHRKSS